MERKFLKRIDEKIYSCLDKNLEIMPIRLVKLIANYYTDARIRKKYYSKLGVKMGENTYPNLGLRVIPTTEEISVQIGSNVSLGPNITFVCSSCPNNGKEINQMPYVKQHLVKVSKIIIEDEVWIGAGVIILPGVTIGKCSIIGAGSTVIEDVEPYSIYAGTPAKKIRDLKTGHRV